MVIDDDSALRMVWRDVLEEEGYRVFEAGDGEEGLSVLDQCRADVVITDLLMPGRGGMETVAEIRMNYPDVKIVAASGGAVVGALSFGEAAAKLGAHGSLQKPVTIQELIDTVRDVLLDD